MRKIELRLFGAFRNLQDHPELLIEAPESVQTVGDLKEFLKTLWTEKSNELPKVSFDPIGLLSKSAVASDKNILLDDAMINPSVKLALLPPVSGG